jgi:uncharacterized protein (DUF2062 family)
MGLCPHEWFHDLIMGAGYSLSLMLFHHAMASVMIWHSKKALARLWHLDTGLPFLINYLICSTLLQQRKTD